MSTPQNKEKSLRLPADLEEMRTYYLPSFTLNIDTYITKQKQNKENACLLVKWKT